MMCPEFELAIEVENINGVQIVDSTYV